MKTPFTHIHGEDGSLYMERFWLVPFKFERTLPWGFGRLLQEMDIAVRVHHIVRPDQSRDMHDHPWNFISFVLHGWYTEDRPASPHWPTFDADGAEHRYKAVRKRWSIAFRRWSHRHTISDLSVDGAWSLFITFKKHNGWGFFTPQGKVYYRDYNKPLIVTTKRDAMNPSREHESTQPEGQTIGWTAISDDHLPPTGDFVLLLSHSGKVSLEQGSHARFLWKDAKATNEGCYYAFWMVCPIPPQRESMNPSREHESTQPEGVAIAKRDGGDHSP